MKLIATLCLAAIVAAIKFEDGQDYNFAQQDDIPEGTCAFFCDGNSCGWDCGEFGFCMNGKTYYGDECDNDCMPDNKDKDGNFCIQKCKHFKFFGARGWDCGKNGSCTSFKGVAKDSKGNSCDINCSLDGLGEDGKPCSTKKPKTTTTAVDTAAVNTASKGTAAK